MGTETGRILKVDQKSMTVQLAAGDHCKVCAAKSVCSFQSEGNVTRLLRLPKSNGIRPGQQIELEYKESSRLLAAFVVFFLPLVFLLAGYFIGNLYWAGINSGVLGAITGFLLSIPVLYFINRWLSHSALFLPRVRGRVHNGHRNGISHFGSENHLLNK